MVALAMATERLLTFLMGNSTKYLLGWLVIAVKVMYHFPTILLHTCLSLPTLSSFRDLYFNIDLF